ncbi:MAG: hypothetical protein M1836_003381 [Candelina mexicana]|nr:MAG: hypothetical protein M1836_003381 [Candelina mexicana]
MATNNTMDSAADRKAQNKSQASTIRHRRFHEYTESELTIAVHSPFTSMSTPDTICVVPTEEDGESNEENAKVSHTFSVTWASEEEREHEKFVAIRNAMSRIVPRSDIVPWKYPDWLVHRVAMLQMRRNIIDRKLTLAVAMAGTVKIRSAFGGRKLSLRRGSVLSLSTIWCPWSDGVDRADAPWPGLQEMKWEGDDRARTGVSRFPPMPREPGNETVVWHQLKAIVAWEFDQVRQLPRLGESEVALPEDEIPQVIGNELWGAIED